MTSEHLSKYLLSQVPWYTIIYFSVTVEGSSSDQVLGVMCQVRNSDDEPVGTFELNSDETMLQLRECTNADDTVTHNQRVNEDSVSFMWNPPSGDEGDLTVRCGTFALTAFTAYSFVYRAWSTLGVPSCNRWTLSGLVRNRALWHTAEQTCLEGSKTDKIWKKCRNIKRLNISLQCRRFFCWSLFLLLALPNSND